MSVCRKDYPERPERKKNEDIFFGSEKRAITWMPEEQALKGKGDG